MKKLALGIVAAAGIASAASAQAQAQEGFTGDVKLACEAILCLSTGQRPSQCTPSLKRYFSISYRRFSDTLKGRTSFLQLCPAANQDAKMQALVNDIANGAGRCDAASLNLALASWNIEGSSGSIGDGAPSYCTAYSANAYTNGVAARYVGTPERNGFWVDPADYEQALRDYNARIFQEAQQPRFNDSSPGG